MPISAFLSSAETATILGISRQALHKHRRISRGFIFKTSFGGNQVYLKKSVKRFLEKADGRFKLITSHADTATKRPRTQRQESQATSLYVAESRSGAV